MNIYSLLFIDSFYATFVFSLSNETNWFVAKEFGVYSMLPVTLVSFAGALCGALASYAIGYGVSRLRNKLYEVDEELFAKLRHYYARYGIIVFLFQMLPFTRLFLFFAGVFVVPFRKFLAFVLIGRAAYYLYYLFLLPHIPSLSL